MKPADGITRKHFDATKYSIQNGAVYTSYAQAKLAHPEHKIVTTGKNWSGAEYLSGTFEPLLDSHATHDDTCWMVCNPADHCSSLNDFINYGLELESGDKYIIDTDVVTITTPSRLSTEPARRFGRFILSAAALNGGCKIPEGEGANTAHSPEDFKGGIILNALSRVKAFLAITMH